MFTFRSGEIDGLDGRESTKFLLFLAEDIPFSLPVSFAAERVRERQRAESERDEKRERVREYERPLLTS